MWLILLAGNAAADELAPPESVSRSPFVTLDTLDGITRVGADFSALEHDDSIDNVTLHAQSIHGHIVEPRTGLGGCARVSWFELSDTNYYVPDGAGSDTSSSGRSNTTLGLMWAPVPVSTRLAFVTHLGFTLARGMTPELFRSSYARVASSMLRPLDFYASLPRSTTADVGGSILWRRGPAVARVDAGLHPANQKAIPTSVAQLGTACT